VEPESEIPSTSPEARYRSVHSAVEEVDDSFELKFPHNSYPFRAEKGPLVIRKAWRTLLHVALR